MGFGPCLGSASRKSWQRLCCHSPPCLNPKHMEESLTTGPFLQLQPTSGFVPSALGSHSGRTRVSARPDEFGHSGVTGQEHVGALCDLSCITCAALGLSCRVQRAGKTPNRLPVCAHLASASEGESCCRRTQSPIQFVRLLNHRIRTAILQSAIFDS